MRTITSAIMIVAVFSSTNSVEAQSAAFVSAPQIQTSRRLTSVEAPFSRSSTAYESYQTGDARKIQAFGDYLQDEAQAAYVWQHVESLHYDNKLKKTATALNRKIMLQDYREYQRDRRDRQKEESQLKLEQKYTELALIYRLDEFQLDRQTGAIYWPASLASPRYAKDRILMEKLMRQLVSYHPYDSQIVRTEITSAARRFRNKLSRDLQEGVISVDDGYVDMQKFLLGLKYAPYLMDDAVFSGEELAMLAR